MTDLPTIDAHEIAVGDRVLHDGKWRTVTAVTVDEVAQPEDLQRLAEDCRRHALTGDLDALAKVSAELNRQAAKAAQSDQAGMVVLRFGGSRGALRAGWGDPLPAARAGEKIPGRPARKRRTGPPLADVAARIDAHLKRLEADDDYNRYVNYSGRDDRRLFHAQASKHGSRVAVTYILTHGANSLTGDEADRYLAWLDAGNKGKHTNMPAA